MARRAYILTAFAALAAWAGAHGQPPAAPSPADQLRLLKANSTLLDNLVDSGVGMSGANQIEDRADRCRTASRALANAAAAAAEKQDAERVAELTALFRNVVTDGLVPTLADGKRAVTPESPAARKLREVRDTAAKDVTGLKSAIPTTGKLGQSARVLTAIQQLDDLADALEKLK